MNRKPIKRTGFKVNKPKYSLGVARKPYQWKPSRRVSERAKINARKEDQCKRAVRRRDNYQCQFSGCWFISRSIDVHHIAMRSRRPDLKFVQDNCVALCREHHSWVHAHQEQAISMGLLSNNSYEKAAKAA